MHEVVNIPLDDIFSDSDFNCRGTMPPSTIQELARDINKHGLIQPIIIRPCSDKQQQETDCHYSIVAGHRRYAAHVFGARQYPNMQTISAIIRTDLTDVQALVINLQENMGRQNLNVMQEAKTIKSLVALGLSREEISKEIGKSPGWVQVRTMLLMMSKEVQTAAEAGFLTTTQIRDMYTLRSDPKKQNEIIIQLKTKHERGDKSAHEIIQKKARKANYRISCKRTQAEINQLREHIQATIGNNSMTRVLAWAAGNINDIEIHKTIKEFAVAIGRQYFIPADIIAADIESEE